MKQKIISIIIFIITCFQTPAFCAQILFNEQIDKISPYISNIKTCGSWNYDGKRGYYRVIHVGFFNGCSLLYIQWVKEGEHPKVVYTLSIDEFNADDHIEFLFDSPICKAISKGINIELNAVSGHDDIKRKIKIKVFHKFGTYNFKERIIK